jgi:hypothetical protein
MTTARTRVWTMALVFCLLASLAMAQQKDPRVNQPVPPVTAGESSSKSADDPAAPAPPQTPDTSPLSGNEVWTLGNLSNTRSLLVPTFRFFQVGDTNTSSTAGSGRTSAVTTVAGQIGLQWLKSAGQFHMDYRGGGVVYNSQTNTQSHYHGLDLRYVANGRRFTLMMANSFMFLPEANFGGGGLGGIGGGFGGNFGGGFGHPGGLLGGSGGLGGFGGGLGGNFQPGITPSQSIFNGFGARFSNTVITQMQFVLNRRSSLTMSGSFGAMRFLEGGSIESNSYQFRTGYDFQITGRDTLAVFYAVGLQRFVGVDRSFDNHNVMISYGRRITGRLAWQVAGGPRVNVFDNQIQGSGRNLAWTLRSNLAYSLSNSTLGLGYARATTSGSGVFLGAETDRLSMSYSRPLSRMWTASMNFGYAHNRSLRELTVGTASNTFHSVTGGISLSRPVGRQGSLYFVYNTQYQRSNFSFCTPGTTSCGRFMLRHHFGLGFTFGLGPYELE